VILGIDSDNEGNSRPQGSRQGNVEVGTLEEDRKIPALVPTRPGTNGNDDGTPRLVRDPRNQNPHAPLADDYGDEEAQVNGSRIWMLNIEEDAHSVVIQLVVAHISILVYGMEVRNPGKPSSS